MKLPEEYLRRAEKLFGEEYPLYLKAMEEKPVRSLRVNTAKISPEEFEKIAPFSLRPVPWCQGAYYFEEGERPGTHPFYYAGLYYLQEASAMVPASILPVKAHMSVLDACCAPGGKSTALMCAMGNTGMLVSNDISASRQNATLKTMGRFGARNAYVTAADLSDLAAKSAVCFDAILLDAPCSGEGMFRREPSLISEWEKKGSAFYAPLQKELIGKAWEMLKPGGMMVYSTCTFAPEEDEEVILHLLQGHQDARLVPPENRHERFAPGVMGLQDCVRMYPHRLQGEGHFAALLKKDGELTCNTKRTVLNTKLPDALKEFLRSVRMEIDERRIMIRDERAYLLPEYELPASKVRVLCSGLLLGTLKKGRFEPSQQLALALQADLFAQAVTLSADDPAVLSFLRGETVRTDEEHRGWVLVCLDRWPLGFAKAEGHTLKNKTDRGWRML